MREMFWLELIKRQFNVSLCCFSSRAHSHCQNTDLTRLKYNNTLKNPPFPANNETHVAVFSGIRELRCVSSLM